MKSYATRRMYWWPAVLAVLLFAVVAPGANVGGTHAQEGGTIDATFASPTIDGSNVDWAAIPGQSLTLEQFEIPAGVDWEFNGDVEPVSAVLKVANDDDNIYVLVEVSDTFDYVADDHGLSAALGVMFLVDGDGPAGPHMGAIDGDFETGLGMVDLWHWELDCAAGALSGGGDAGSGDDPDCNLDDEYATDPETREDDDGTGAENSLVGSWNHTGGTVGADGTWVFEMSRPLDTGDATDAQFAVGSVAKVAIAYWDPKESPIGWSDAGHLTSADAGWVQVNLASQAAADPTATTAPADDTPTTAPTTAPADDTPTTAAAETPDEPAVGNAGLAGDSDGGGFPVGGAAIAALLVVAILVAVAAFGMKRKQA